MITRTANFSTNPVTVTLTDDETEPPTTVIIEFDDLHYELLERDPEERMEVYIALGEGNDGKKYKGSAVFFCDELDSIDDIEED